MLTLCQALGLQTLLNYFHVKPKITNADGTNFAGTAQMGLVNLWMHVLFSQVEVYLDNKLVTSSSTSYPYRAYIETIEF